MTFALTKVRAYGVEAEEPRNKRYRQFLVLDITAANTDVDLDIGEHVSGSLGTFWNAVDGSEPGDTGLKAIRDIVKRADCLVAVGGKGVVDLQRGTSAASGVYTQATANKGPNLLYDSGTAPTAYTVICEWLLKDGEEPVSLYATSATQTGS